MLAGCVLFGKKQKWQGGGRGSVVCHGGPAVQGPLRPHLLWEGPVGARRAGEAVAASGGLVQADPGGGAVHGHAGLLHVHPQEAR